MDAKIDPFDGFVTPEMVPLLETIRRLTEERDEARRIARLLLTGECPECMDVLAFRWGVGGMDSARCNCGWTATRADLLAALEWMLVIVEEER